jgi:hypothetical protein
MRPGFIGLKKTVLLDHHKLHAAVVLVLFRNGIVLSLAYHVKARLGQAVGSG